MAIGGCSNEVPYDELQDRDGLKYEINSQRAFTGSAVLYYENGQLGSIRNYKDGKQDGLYELYRENGELMYKTNYKDGEEIPLN